MADESNNSHLSDEELLDRLNKAASTSSKPSESSPGVISSFGKGLFETGPEQLVSGVKTAANLAKALNPALLLQMIYSQKLEAPTSQDIETAARNVGRPAMQLAGALTTGGLALPTGPGAIPAAAAGAAGGGLLFDKLLQTLGIDQTPTPQEEANKLAEEFGSNLSGELITRGLGKVPQVLGKGKIATQLAAEKIAGPGSALATKLEEIKTGTSPEAIQATAGQELKNLGQTEEGLSSAAIQKQELAKQNPAMANLTTAEVTGSPELAILEKELSTASSTGLATQKATQAATTQADELITNLSKAKTVNKATTGEDVQKLFKEKRKEVGKQVGDPFKGEIMQQAASPKGAASEVEDALSSWRQEGRAPVDSKVEKIADDLKALDSGVEVPAENFGTKAGYKPPQPKLEVPDTTVGALHNIRSRALSVARETKNTQVKAQALAVADVASNKIESALGKSSPEWKTMNANYRDYMDLYYRGKAAKTLGGKAIDPEKFWGKLRTSSGVEDFQKIFGGLHPESLHPANANFVDTIVSTYPKTGTVAAKMKWIESNRPALEKTGLWDSFQKSKDYFEKVTNAKAQAGALNLEHLPISERSKTLLQGKSQKLQALGDLLLAGIYPKVGIPKAIYDLALAKRHAKIGNLLSNELSKAKNPAYAAQLVQKADIKNTIDTISQLGRQAKLGALKQELFTPMKPTVLQSVPSGTVGPLLSALFPSQQQNTSYSNLTDEEFLKMLNQ
jgi:hypothetical protein